MTVDEIVKEVNIATDAALLEECPAADTDGSGDVAINEIVQAVNHALSGCL